MTEEEIQQKIKDLESRLSEHDERLKKIDILDYKMTLHQHTGVDETNKLKVVSVNQYSTTLTQGASTVTVHNVGFRPLMVFGYMYAENTSVSPYTTITSAGVAGVNAATTGISVGTFFTISTTTTPEQATVNVSDNLVGSTYGAITMQVTNWSDTGLTTSSSVLSGWSIVVKLLITG